MTRDSRDREQLPEEVSRALGSESDAERAALERVWQLAGAPLRDEPSADEFAQMGADVWQKLEATVRDSPRPARIHQRHRAWRWSVVTASILLLTLVGILYLSDSRTLTAGPGERLAITLPDGSTVELNSGASLTYAPNTFGWFSRTASLEGEAFFQVVPDESDFITRTFNAEVRVLGTSFNVRAWPEEGDRATVVTLHTGTVRLASRSGAEQAVVLRPGQMSRVISRNETPSQPQATDLSQASAWRTGRFVFVDEPLSAILAEIERRFGVTVRAGEPAILDDRLSLAYEDPASAQAILSDIASSYSRYQYRRITGGYELYVP